MPSRVESEGARQASSPPGCHHTLGDFIWSRIPSSSNLSRSTADLGRPMSDAREFPRLGTFANGKFRDDHLSRPTPIGSVDANGPSSQSEEQIHVCRHFRSA